MALRITCPYCSRKHELAEPYPLPGSDLHCWCGAALSISYPAGLMDRLRKRGIRFQGDPEPFEIEEESLERPSMGGAPVESSSPLPSQEDPNPSSGLDSRTSDDPGAGEARAGAEDSLQNLPALDAWERLNTNETDHPSDPPAAADDETIVMNQRQAALKAAREHWETQNREGVSSETTSDLGGMAPTARDGSLPSAGPETTADMGGDAPFRRGKDHTGEDTSEMGDAAPKLKPPLPTSPGHPSGAGGGKPPFYKRKWVRRKNADSFSQRGLF